MFSHRRAAFIRSVAVIVVGALVIWFGAAAAILAIYGRDAEAAAPWLALAKLASLAWVGAVGWRISWRRLDEMEQETRKFSWFVGSTSAIMLTAPIMVFLLVGGGASFEQILGRRSTPGAFFALGWVGLALAQMVGSLVARAGRRMTKR